jgi:hypothetical protein
MKIALIGLLTAGFVGVPAVAGTAAPKGGCPYPPNRPVLKLFASPATVIARHSETAYGNFTQNSCGISGATIRLQRRLLVGGEPRGSWYTFATVTTNSNGVFAAHRRPWHNEEQRALFSAAGGFPSTSSRVVAVAARTAVSLAATRLSNCRIRLTGATSPTKARHTIRIQLRGPRGQFEGWGTVGRWQTDTRGHYLTIGKFSCGKVYNLSVYITADARNAAGRSRTIYGLKAVKNP